MQLFILVAIILVPQISAILHFLLPSKCWINYSSGMNHSKVSTYLTRPWIPKGYREKSKDLESADPSMALLHYFQEHSQKKMMHKRTCWSSLYQLGNLKIPFLNDQIGKNHNSLLVTQYIEVTDNSKPWMTWDFQWYPSPKLLLPPNSRTYTRSDNPSTITAIDKCQCLMDDISIAWLLEVQLHSYMCNHDIYLR